MSEGIVFCRVTGCNLPLNTLLSSTGRAGQRFCFFFSILEAQISSTTL